MKIPGCGGVYQSCALGGSFQMAYTALSLAFGMRFNVRIHHSLRLTRVVDVPAFLAIIRFSHPWRNRKLITTLHRTICQDSTAYFLSVLSIQIFVTVAVSSRAPVSLHGARLNNRRFLPRPPYLVPSGSLPCLVSFLPIIRSLSH